MAFESFRNDEDCLSVNGAWESGVVKRQLESRCLYIYTDSLKGRAMGLITYLLRITLLVLLQYRFMFSVIWNHRSCQQFSRSSNTNVTEKRLVARVSALWDGWGQRALHLQKLQIKYWVASSCHTWGTNSSTFLVGWGLIFWTDAKELKDAAVYFLATSFPRYHCLTFFNFSKL